MVYVIPPQVVWEMVIYSNKTQYMVIVLVLCFEWNTELILSVLSLFQHTVDSD